MNNNAKAYLIGLLVLCLSVLGGIVMGSVHIPISGMIRSIFDQSDQYLSSTQLDILYQIRFPRVILAGLVGLSLGITGASYQGVFNNFLVDPYLLGVSAGAGLGATIAIVAGLNFVILNLQVSVWLAFIGAITTVLFSLLLSKSSNFSTNTILLAGVSLSIFLVAIQMWLVSLNAGSSKQVYSWMFGGLATLGWSQITWLMIYVIPAGAYLAFKGRQLDILRFGDAEAYSLGVDPKNLRIQIILVSTFLIAAAVSVSGLIGFVGLLVPHFIRLAFTYSYRNLIALSALYGSSFLVIADTFSKTSSLNMPIGIITALVGAPFFLFLLFKSSRNFNEY